MKQDQGNAAFATPYFSETETRQIGETRDKRAVWQNNFGPPFVCVYDAKGTRHLFPCDVPFTPYPPPHKTWKELHGDTEATPTPTPTPAP